MELMIHTWGLSNSPTGGVSPLPHLMLPFNWKRIFLASHKETRTNSKQPGKDIFYCKKSVPQPKLGEPAPQVGVHFVYNEGRDCLSLLVRAGHPNLTVLANS